MQRVLVDADRTPFTDAARDAMCDRLISALLESGADAEAIKLPCQDNGSATLPGMLARRSFDVWNADRLIALTFPACLITHPEKVVWFVDDAGLAHDGAPAVVTALRDAKRVYSASRLTATRLFRETRCRSAVLPLPSKDADWGRIVGKLLS